MTLLSDDRLIGLYRLMALQRVLFEQMVEKNRTWPVKVIGMAPGQEAIPAGACAAIRTLADVRAGRAERTDIVVGTLSHGQHLAMGMDLVDNLAERYGKTAGANKGHSGSMNLSSKAHGLAGFDTVLGGDFGIACGFGLAAVIRKHDQVVLCGVGDGTTDQGRFHEGLNFAALKRLPVVFIVSNNGFAGSTPFAEHSAARNVADHAAGYGIPGVIVDGNDVLEVYEAVATAVERARAGEGPSLIECLTFRWGDYGFGGGPPVEGRQPAEGYQQREPLFRFGRLLVERGLASEADLAAWRAEAATTIADGYATIELLPEPDAGDVGENLYG